jgi:hypothetical protein
LEEIGLGPSRKGYRAYDNSVADERKAPHRTRARGYSAALCREAVALYIHQHRPQAEVSTISPEGVDAEVRRSSPHLVVVYNEASEAVREVAIAWARILFGIASTRRSA